MSSRSKYGKPTIVYSDVRRDSASSYGSASSDASYVRTDLSNDTESIRSAGQSRHPLSESDAVHYKSLDTSRGPLVILQERR